MEYLDSFSQIDTELSNEQLNDYLNAIIQTHEMLPQVLKRLTPITHCITYGAHWDRTQEYRNALWLKVRTELSAGLDAVLRVEGQLDPAALTDRPVSQGERILALTERWHAGEDHATIAKLLQGTCVGTDATYDAKQLLRLVSKKRIADHSTQSGAPGKRPTPVRVQRPMQVQSALNDMWSMDFMTDVTTKGKRFWILNIVDDFNREAVATEVSDRRSAAMVVRCLRELQSLGRIPKAIRSDNGMEFKGNSYIAWAEAALVRRIYIRPASPTENVIVERFNLTMRQEVLDRYLLTSIAEASRMLEDRRVRYNLARPHHSLGGLSPLQYAALVKPACAPSLDA